MAPGINVAWIKKCRFKLRRIMFPLMRYVEVQIQPTVLAMIDGLDHRGLCETPVCQTIHSKTTAVC